MSAFHFKPGRETNLEPSHVKLTEEENGMLHKKYLAYDQIFTRSILKTLGGAAFVICGIELLARRMEVSDLLTAVIDIAACTVFGMYAFRRHERYYNMRNNKVLKMLVAESRTQNGEGVLRKMSRKVWCKRLEANAPEVS